MDENAALLQQMLQEQAQQQQQPLQHQYQQQQQPQQQQFAAPMQSFSYGQQGFAAPQFGLSAGFPQAGMPYGLPSLQQQQGAFLPAQQQQQQSAFLQGAAPAFLQQPLADGVSGALPPAILQHQQAALARQQQQQQQQQQQTVLPSMPLPGMALQAMPPASVASNGVLTEGMPGTQQPSWALLQQAAAAVGAVPPMVAMPTLPLMTEQPAASTSQQPTALTSLLTQPGAAGGTAAASTGTGAPSGAPASAPKRRGRQPKDPSTLTEKQLRAREAQKRFRDKQKRMMSETEQAVTAASVELERLRVSNESQKLKNEVLERMLQYKEAQVHALEFQKQMDPPPRFTVSADMVEMMRREGIAGLFTPEVLLRYAVAGYTEHMDERGEVKEPPPFEKVAEDWRDMVMLVKEILDTARQTPGYAAEPAAAGDTVGTAAPAATRASPQFVELHSGSTVGGAGSTAAGAGTSSGDSHQRTATSGGQGQQDAQEQRVPSDLPGSLGHAPGAGEGQGEVNQRGPGADFQASVTGEALPDAAALVSAEAGAAAAGGPQPSQSAVGSGSGGSSHRRAAPLGVVPKDVLPEVAAIAEEAPEDVLEAAEAKDDPIARFVLARILSQTAAHSHLQWDTLVEGAAVQDGPDLYRFTGKQLRTLAHLMRRVGLMLWQQALLFPQHITKLGTVRLDDPNNLHVEEQDPEHWRGILRRLHCRPEQLRKIVTVHQRYMARMRPVLEERKQALEVVKSITEMQALSAFGPNDSTASFVVSTTKLTEATGLVMQTVSAQHAAYCELLIAIIYALTFPVQRPQLFVLSWPYFPQLQLLCRAAALELGLDISQYPQCSTDWSDDL